MADEDTKRIQRGATTTSGRSRPFACFVVPTACPLQFSSSDDHLTRGWLEAVMASNENNKLGLAVSLSFVLGYLFFWYVTVTGRWRMCVCVCVFVCVSMRVCPSRVVQVGVRQRLTCIVLAGARLPSCDDAKQYLHHGYLTKHDELRTRNWHEVGGVGLGCIVNWHEVGGGGGGGRVCIVNPGMRPFDQFTWRVGGYCFSRMTLTKPSHGHKSRYAQCLFMLYRHTVHTLW